MIEDLLPNRLVNVIASGAISAGNEIATSAAGLLAMTKWDILGLWQQIH